jgi:hypothetical protein
MNDNKKMISPCGVYCGSCAAHTVKQDDTAMIERLVNLGIKKEDLPCKGCRPLDGHCPTITGDCENYECAKDKGVYFCYECKDFPCSRLHPAADRANTLVQNMKVFNLCLIQKHGIEKWLEKLPKIKKTYFFGKITYGKGPKSED